ncbi:MAG: ABC transporter ATP-binding protein [Burkholderiaceae bacterium]
MGPGVLTAASAEPAVRLEGLRFAWPGQKALLALDNFEVPQGSTVLLQGASGSGKTTLLSLIVGVLSAQQGIIRVLGQTLSQMRPAQRDVLRGASIGVIFQLFNLLPFLSVRDNVLLPVRMFAQRRLQLQEPEAQHREAARLVVALGLSDAVLHRQAHQLSVGQQQRVAAARALIGNPPLIVADEPTSALDEDTQQEFLSLLIQQVRQTGASLLMVSHDSRLAGQFDRVVRL